MKNLFVGGQLAFYIFVSTVSAILPTQFVHATTVDLALDSNNITFSASTLYVDDSVRIYARVRNVGDVDATASVIFYQGGMVIGQSQPVSLRAGGNPDDVFVDFIVPQGSFNIRAVLQGSTPQDTNPDNDSAITPLYAPIADVDRDNVIDDADNCKNDANTDQVDTDSDGNGDACDTDDDNDMVLDAADPAPLDKAVTGIPVPKPSAPVIVKSPASTSTNASATAALPTAEESPIETQSSTQYSDEASNTIKAAPVVAKINATSKLSLSPLARFSWKQIDWRTYEFILADQPTDGVRFGWDFGDGATSAQPKITHAFSGPGTYTVALAIIDSDGKTISDAQTFDVSFFHLDNPQVMILIVLLLVFLAAFGFAFLKLRKSYDKGALHE